MKSESLRRRGISLFLFLGTLVLPCCYAAAAMDDAETLAARRQKGIASVNQGLDTLEKQQQDVLDRQENILKSIEQVKIQARHNPSGSRQP